MIPEDSILRRHYLTELANKPISESYSNFTWFVSIFFVILILLVI